MRVKPDFAPCLLCGLPQRPGASNGKQKLRHRSPEEPPCAEIEKYLRAFERRVGEVSWAPAQRAALRARLNRIRNSLGLDRDDAGRFLPDD